MLCPECNTELDGNPEKCYLCGSELPSDEQSDKWTVIGTVENAAMSGLAEETLKSSGIEAVVISKSGFFGAAGLPLNPFYKGDSPAFEISVPAERCKEAVELLDMTLGDQWQKKDQ